MKVHGIIQLTLSLVCLGTMYARGADESNVSRYLGSSAYKLYFDGLKKQWGWEGKPDYSTAAHCFNLSSLLENPYAQLELGNAYMLGRGEEKDEARAVELYREAARHGVYEARVNLGQCYERGIGVQQDAKEAVRWYRKARAINIPSALIDYEAALLETSPDSTVDYKLCRVLAFLDKILGEHFDTSEADRLLAHCYMEGIGVRKDEKTARIISSSAGRYVAPPFPLEEMDVKPRVSAMAEGIYHWDGFNSTNSAGARLMIGRSYTAPREGAETGVYLSYGAEQGRARHADALYECRRQTLGCQVRVKMDVSHRFAFFLGGGVVWAWNEDFRTPTGSSRAVTNHRHGISGNLCVGLAYNITDSVDLKVAYEFEYEPEHFLWVPWQSSTSQHGVTFGVHAKF